LPMLANSPIDTIPMSGSSPTKEIVDMQVRQDIFAWIRHSRMIEPRSYRLLVEKLVDVTKHSTMYEENEKFIGRSELQRYLKEKMSNEFSKNHQEQCFMSTISDTTDQRDTAAITSENLYQEKINRIAITKQEEKRDCRIKIASETGKRQSSKKLLLNKETLHSNGHIPVQFSKETNISDDPSNIEGDISTRCSKGLKSRRFSRSLKALKTTSFLTPEEYLPEEKALLQEEKTKETVINEKPLHVIGPAVSKPMKEPSVVTYKNEVPCQSEMSQLSISETVTTLLELGYNEDSQEKTIKNINQKYISANKRANTKGKCGCSGKDTIEDRKSSYAANYTVALAESVGFLDYRFAKGKKRLRKLRVRHDCCYPL
jgi:hypothetical protein